jgi:uncharacterized membrane protein YfcA
VGCVLAVVFAVGIAAGLFSGLLGVGGAVVLLPLLTTFAGMSLKEASNVTLVQVVAASVVSWAAYHRGRAVHLRLALHMGVASAAGGLVGSYGSRAFSSRALEWLFLGVVLTALGLLLAPGRSAGPVEEGHPRFNRALAAGLGTGAGLLAGLLGAGGGFLIVPLMVGALRLPPRLAVGSSPVVILVGASFALAGKILAGVVDPRAATALVVGATPAAYLGARIGQRLPGRVLRLLLGLVLVGVAIRAAVPLVVPHATGAQPRTVRPAARPPAAPR